MRKEDQLMAGFWDIFNKKTWLNSIKLKAGLKGYTPSEIHCIEYIQKHMDSNNTELAEAFYMTRSAISKLTKKLINKGLIESYQKPDNKKEVYFRLTKQGKEIYKIHEELDKEFHERDKSVFEGITTEQYDLMISFAQKYNRHLDSEISKLGIDLKTQGPDRL